LHCPEQVETLLFRHAFSVLFALEMAESAGIALVPDGTAIFRSKLFSFFHHTCRATLFFILRILSPIDGCLKETDPPKRAVSFTCRCRSFGRTAPRDFCHPLQEPDSAGPVSDHRRAADPASDPTVDLAERADSGSSWHFLLWERAYNGSQFGFVPEKEKCGSQWRNYLSPTCSNFSNLRLLI
jgi:hypothetical protein